MSYMMNKFGSWSDIQDNVFAFLIDSAAYGCSREDAISSKKEDLEAVRTYGLSLECPPSPSYIHKGNAPWDDDDDEVDDEAELNLEKVEEEMAADYSDEVNFQGGSVAQEYKAPRNGKKLRKVLMSFA